MKTELKKRVITIGMYLTWIFGCIAGMLSPDLNHTGIFFAMYFCCLLLFIGSLVYFFKYDVEMEQRLCGWLAVIGAFNIVLSAVLLPLKIAECPALGAALILIKIICCGCILYRREEIKQEIEVIRKITKLEKSLQAAKGENYNGISYH